MKTTVIVSVLAVMIMLPFAQPPAAAQDPASDAKKDKDPSVELKATEITESLQNIVGSYKLEQMEIVGSSDQPQFNYILRWQDPVPFPDEKETVSGAMTKPYDTPMDNTEYEQMLKITTDK